MIGYDFVAPGTPNATAIVRIDPDFYRARRSSAEVRAILVRIPNAYRERSLSTSRCTASSIGLLSRRC